MTVRPALPGAGSRANGRRERPAPTFDLSTYSSRLQELLGPGQEGGDLFWRALEFAARVHADQRRRSGEPYISHPCAVAEILVRDMGVKDQAVLAAALLHDTVEDVPELVTVASLTEEFGPQVAGIVDACTKLPDLTGDRQTARKRVHRKIFAEAASRIEVMLVKLADRLHNMRTLDSLRQDKRQKIAEETLDIYAPIAKLMGLYELKRELFHHALVHKFPSKAQRLLAHIGSLPSDPEVQAIKRMLDEEMRRVWLEGRVEVRPKGLGAYYDPVGRRLRSEIDGAVELIVLVNDRPACYRALGVVNLTFPPIPTSIRDYIANQKPSGYQSLHSRANIWGRTYLFKFRTRRMAEAYRIGILSRWTPDGRNLKAFESQLREMFDVMGQEGELSYREIIQATDRKEICTFTPKGDQKWLPKESTVLDFAFQIHTEIGERCSHGVIGGQRVEVDHVLADGDRIEIVCHERPAPFDPEILTRCRTARARAVLAKIVRSRRTATSRELGRAIVRQELRRYGVPQEVLEREGMIFLLEYFQVAGLDDLYQGVGEGRLGLREIMWEIQHGLWAGRRALEPPTGAFNQFQLATLDPVSVKLSACCHPLPVERGLLGLVSERGLSVHRRDCGKFRDLKMRREDVVELRWRLKETPVPKPQRIVLTGASAKWILYVLSEAPPLWIVERAQALSPEAPGTAAWRVDFTVASLADLKAVLAHFATAGVAARFTLEQ
ncbi:MAG: HD domain-containing protein [Thermodesulfobacteriota bacterium]